MCCPRIPGMELANFAFAFVFLFFIGVAIHKSIHHSMADIFSSAFWTLDTQSVMAGIAFAIAWWILAALIGFVIWGTFRTSRMACSGVVRCCYQFCCGPPVPATSDSSTHPHHHDPIQYDSTQFYSAAAPPSYAQNMV